MLFVSDTMNSRGVCPLGVTMNRRYFLVVFLIGALAAATVSAATYEDSIVAQLKSQGYNSITVERTLLGRIKIIGKIDTGRREIILNPRTGEIMRDIWLTKSGKSDGPKLQSQPNSGGPVNGDDGDPDDNDPDNDDQDGGDQDGGDQDGDDHEVEDNSGNGNDGDDDVT